MRRRTLLKLGILGGVSLLGAGILYRLRNIGFPDGPLTDEENRLVSVLTDLLIPSEPEFPGALDLGVDRKIIEKADKDASLRRHIKYANQWLNWQAGRHSGYRFFTLPRERQEELLTRAETSFRRSRASHFFKRIRTESFQYFYSDPIAWKGLCFPGPPQPLGFLDYAEPPKPCV